MDTTHNFTTMKRLSFLIFSALFSLLLAAGASLCAAESPAFSVENRSLHLMNGSAFVSPVATTGSKGTKLLADGAAASGWSAESPIWDTATVEDGYHTLALSEGDSASAEVLVINDAGVVIHDGTLEADEVWAAGVIHVVRNSVRIPAGRRLVIANGAVVKFCQGTGIVNEGTLSAISATLTAFEDDTVKGDTNLDGTATTPAADTYAIRNNGTLTAIGCTLKYATPDSVFESTTIADGAFEGCGEITQAVIPLDVDHIGENAFQGCSNLTNVTFQGNNTTVADTAFDGCDNIGNVYFPNDLPKQEYVFGNSQPTIHVGRNPYPETWGGYPVVDAYASIILAKAIPAPVEAGEAGQVLTLDEDGTTAIWKDIPVDGELDASSTNAVQNAVVAAAVAELQNASAAVKSDVTALQAKDAALSSSVVNLQGESAAIQGEINALKGDVEGLHGMDDKIASLSSELRGEVVALKSDNQSLKTENQSLQNEVAALSNDLRTLLALLGETGSASQVLTKGEDGSYAWKNADALGSEVMEIKLEAGWNLVAMPGRVAFDESTEALLKNIEIFTFDKKTKVYQPSEGLEPLASYWMRAPEPCTIHFLVIAETP